MFIDLATGGWQGSDDTWLLDLREMRFKFEYYIKSLVGGHG